MSIDIAKQLDTSKPTDVSKRFVTTEDYLRSTASTPKSSNVVTFAETADVIQPKEPNTIDQESLQQDELNSLDQEFLKSLEQNLGYTPKNQQDVIKGINKTTDKLKKHIKSSVFWRLNKEDFITMNISKSSSSVNLSKYDKSFNTNIIATNDSYENRLLAKYYDNKSTLNRTKHEDRILKSMNKTTKNFFNDGKSLIKTIDKHVKSFISDPLSNEYLSNHLPVDQLKQIQKSITGMLKYATTTCQDMIDLMKTAMYGITDIIDAIDQLMTISIKNNMTNLLNDLMRCFDKLQTTVDEIRSTDNIVKKIESWKHGPSLKVVSNTKSTSSYSPHKALYTTYLNTSKQEATSSEYQQSYDDLKITYSIDDTQYIAYTKKDTLGRDVIIYDVPKIQRHQGLSSNVMKDDPETHQMLSKLPLNTIHGR